MNHAASANNYEQHLQILSELAQRFSDRACREALASAADPAAVLALFATAS